jgi:hypothetical protein
LYPLFIVCSPPCARQHLILVSSYPTWQYNRKKTRTRRLDYDYKKNTNEDLKTKGKPLKFNDPDMKMAEEKFKESYSKAERSMAALVDGEVENVAQLSQFIQAHQTYFEQCASVMADAKAQLETIIANGAGREKTKLTINECEFVPASNALNPSLLTSLLLVLLCGSNTQQHALQSLLSSQRTCYRRCARSDRDATGHWELQ